MFVLIIVRDFYDTHTKAKPETLLLQPRK